MEVVIVGGGIAGLAAAYYLDKLDYDVLVLEENKYFGGRTLNGKWNEFTYPKGTEYIGEPEGKMKQLFNQLGVKAIPVPPPGYALMTQGKIFAKEKLFSCLNDKEKKNYRYMYDELDDFAEKGMNEEAIYGNFKKLNRFKKYDDWTVKEWLDDEKILKINQKLVDAENRGLFGASNKDLSFLFNVPEMAYNLEEYYDENKYKQDDEDVYTFKNGMAEVIDALVDKIDDLVKSNSKVTEIIKKSEKKFQVKYIENGSEKSIHTQAIIFACPAPITYKLTKNLVSNSVEKALSKIKYAPYMTLNIYTKTRLWKTAWSGTSLDDFFVSIYDGIRTQVNLSYNDKSIIGVYIAPERANDKDFIKMSEDKIVKQTLKDLEKYFPGIKDQILGYDLQRFEYAFPVFAPGYFDILDSLHHDSSLEGPLFLAGDYMVYPTFDGAFKSALDAVKKIEDYWED